MNEIRADPLISVVIPTHNRRKILLRCLRSIFESEYRNFEVIVVDDCSSDQTSEEVRKLFPSVRVIRNDRNLLLAASRNRGASTARGDLIMFVDDDNVVDRAAIGELVQNMQAPDLGVAAPLIFHLSDPTKIWYAGSWMSPVSAISVFPYRGSSTLPTRRPFETNLFHDAFMVKRSVFAALGNFDHKSFPIFLSEADFAEKLRVKGYKVMVIPTARVWHDVPVASGISSLLRNIHITEPFRAYYVARNRIIFMKRYRKVAQKLVFLSFFVPIFALIHLSIILGSRKQGKIYFARYYIGGILAGLAARS